VRWLLIIALLVWPACFTPAACAMTDGAMTGATVTAPAKKMSADCCKHGCDCSANPSTPAKETPTPATAPQIVKIAAAPLLFVLSPSAGPDPTHLAESTAVQSAPASVRVQSILCHWTT